MTILVVVALLILHRSVEQRHIGCTTRRGLTEVVAGLIVVGLLPWHGRVEQGEISRTTRQSNALELADLVVTALLLAYCRLGGAVVGGTTREVAGPAVGVGGGEDGAGSDVAEGVHCCRSGSGSGSGSWCEWLKGVESGKCD